MSPNVTLRPARSVICFRLTVADVDLDVWVTRRSGHTRQIAKEFNPPRYDGLCLVGDDGAIYEPVSGLIERGESTSMLRGESSPGELVHSTRHESRQVGRSTTASLSSDGPVWRTSTVRQSDCECWARRDLLWQILLPRRRRWNLLARSRPPHQCRSG